MNDRIEILAETLDLKTTDLVLDGDEIRLREGELTDSQKATLARLDMTVEKYKLEIVLHKQGLLETLNGILEQNPVYKIAWKGTNTVRRISKTVMELAPLLELSEEQVDGLFIEANKIEL